MRDEGERRLAGLAVAQRRRGSQQSERWRHRRGYGDEGILGLESFSYHTPVWVHLDGLYWAGPAGFYSPEVTSSMNHTGRLFASSMIAYEPLD
jgi:hypothetical protein